MMLNGWCLPLRLAFRDMRRYKGRSVLASLLIFLPVMVMGAALTGVSTWQISDTERIQMTMAHASAELDFPDTAGKDSRPLPNMNHAADYKHAPTPAQLDAVHAGRTALLTESALLATQADTTYQGTYGGISGDRQVAGGWFRMVSGHRPRTDSEIVVTTRASKEGFPTKGSITFTDTSHKKHTVQIVGVASSNTSDEVLGNFTLPGASNMEALIAENSSSSDKLWNHYGITRHSRTELELSSHYPEGSSQQFVEAMAAALLVVTLALLAGPAFAASATRSRRTLALLTINGGKRHVLRRVVLAQALLLGSLTSACGLITGGAIGIFLAKNAYRFWPDQISGPIEIPWRYCIGMWVVSTIAALVAAFVPAISAGRTNVLGALRGQVSPRKIRHRMPVLGLTLLATGLSLCYFASNEIVHRQSLGHGKIILGVPLYFAGAMLLVPGLLLGVGHLARYLPVTARIAVREVSRQRTRATAAVGAVLVTTALLSAALVAGLSYDKYLRQQYTPYGPYGAATVDATQFGNNLTPSAFETDAHESIPGSTVTSVRQFESRDTRNALTINNVFFNTKSCSIHDLSYSAGGPRAAQDSGVLVLDTSNPAGLTKVTPEQTKILNDGGLLVVANRLSRTLRPGTKPDGLTNNDIQAGKISATTASITGIDQGKTPTENFFGATHAHCTNHTVPAATVFRDQLGNLPGTTPGTAVMLMSGARHLGGHPSSRYLVVTRGGGISERAVATLTNRILANNQGGFAVLVEHGYSSPVRIVAGVLTGLAVLVVLMTTIIATLLNQAEGKADAATLAASGASRGMSRKVACCQAVAVGAIGGVIGSLVGFGPGAILAYVNTAHSSDQYIYSPIIDIPWQYLGIVILVVPLVAGLVIALTVPRSPEITRRTV